MNCPHCQIELPENCAANWCPFCGQGLIVPETDSAQPQLPPVKTNWPVFFAILLAPTILTILTVRFVSDTGDPAGILTLVGGGISGTICGTLLGWHLGKTFETRIGLAVLFALIMIVVSIGMSFIGCQVSGYQLIIH